MSLFSHHTTARRSVTILITGCSTGIGRCAATVLRERGHRVFATARQAQDVDQLHDAGFDALRLDLTDPDSQRDALDTILRRTQGTLYALFNNGAYAQPGAVEDLPVEALRTNFETNFFGTHDLTRRIIPIMRAQGEGRIIQNSSVLGLVALKYRGAYVATKSPRRLERCPAHGTDGQWHSRRPD
jgi:NAD(P)-dependent dehydrogenase (short-subunit alcohol dehydrogenase family)